MLIMLKGPRTLLKRQQLTRNVATSFRIALTTLNLTLILPSLRLTLQTEKERVSAWQALKLFSGWEGVEKSLRGARINPEENALTLTRDIHTYFDKMRTWFQPSYMPDVHPALIALR
jgi:hypothetical protein